MLSSSTAWDNSVPIPVRRLFEVEKPISQLKKRVYQRLPPIEGLYRMDAFAPDTVMSITHKDLAQMKLDGGGVGS